MARFSFGYFFLLLSLLELEANPSDPTVLAGHASCISTPQKLEVNAHDKTIISWKDFSIGSKETTHFNLPNSHSVILNRASSHNISKIEGLLSSNGIVYLINPNGVLITPTGKIDTAGFLASTLNITDQDFLNGGDILFTGSSGSITNLGAIQCSSGDVILMACQVKNDGTIEAPEGKIALGAAQEIFMTLQGDERLTVRLPPPPPHDSKEEIGLHQTGTLKALQAELKADGNLFAYAIKNEGHINATATVQRNGRIYLVAEKGHVTSSGTLTAPSGEVRVLGQIASLTDNAQIDVSHNKGGGTVLIGGDYQGKNPDILNAQMTYVGPDVVISAAALESGDGGKVIAWADGETFFYGKINSQGGPLGGNGGFAEVSGKQNLDFRGLVDLTAPQGKTGMLLLDPTNVTFSTSADSGFTVIPPTCVSGYILSANPATATVNIANLISNLSTCSVTISTASTNANTGTVTVSNPINWNTASGNTLTVNANAGITFSAAVTNATTAGGSMTWTGTTVSLAGAITNSSTTGNITITGTGAVTQTAAGTITNTSTSGVINIQGSSVTLTSAAIQNGPLTGATATTPTISISSSGGGSFGAATPISMTSNTASGTGIILSGFTTISLNGPITNGPTSGGPSGGGSISITGSGNVIQAVGAPILNNSATGAMTLNTTGVSALQLNGTLTSNSTGLTTLTSLNSLSTAAVTFNAGSLTMIGGGGGSGITTTGLISFPNTGAGSLMINIPVSGSVTINGGITFASIGGNMGITVIGVGGSGQVGVSIQSPVNFTSSGTCIIDAYNSQVTNSAAGTVTINAGSFTMIGGVGGNGIVTNGSITFGTSAGAASIISSKGSTTFNANVTNNSANPLTITSATSIGFGGLLTNNSTFTGTSLFVYAAQAQMNFGANPGGFTSSSPGTSNFTSSDNFSTTSSSTFTTTGAGNVSISALASGLGVTILCPLTLGSSGAFSVTSNTTVSITGSISSTGGGPFTISSPTGTITLSGSTVSFNPGSAVNLVSRGSITLSSPSMTFGGTSGSLTVGTLSAPVGSIAINGPLSYSSPGLCQFISSGTFANNGSGTMTFLSGCGDATFESTASTINFNNTAQVTFQSGAGNAFVTTRPGTGGGMAIGLFDFESGSGKAATFNSNSALTLGANFTYDATSTGSGTCNMTSFGLLTVSGTLALNTSALNMTSTAGGITTTTTTGLINVASAAGALTMNAFGTITIGAALTDLSSTNPLTMTTISPTGAIAINAAITTGGNGNVNATAGGNITLAANITYTQAVGTGTFIAGKADSAGKFSTIALSTLGTSGSANLFIISANAAASDAFNIAGALSPASSGTLSMTAPTGNVTITGAITATAGTFSASALGPSGTVTLSTAATNSFMNTAVNLSAGTGGVTLSTTNTTFAAGGSLTVNSVGPVAINTALTYASTGNCQFISTGKNITNSGILTFNTGSGPISFTANTIANQGITFSAAVTNSSANALTITSSGTTAFNALMTNASTLGTTSFIASAGENITLGATPGGFTSSSPGASTFTANTAALGSFSTAANSVLSTTAGAGAVSITAANATGTTAISILCPITLVSAGAFSATATTGNVVISGTISNTTTGGTFNVSAPGESGAITLSNTINFTPGSAVSLASTGLTTLSGATMTFGGTSGSLTVGTSLAPVGSIAINGALNYSSPGACQFIASGNIANNTSGVMTFLSGSGAVTFESTASTITFNATPLIQFQSGAGSVTVKTDANTGGAITVGPFTFNSAGSQTAGFSSNSTLTFNGAFNYGGSSATSTLTSAGLLTLNAALNLNAAGAFNMASTGQSPSAGITTTASGPIAVLATAGPLTMNSVGTITLGAALNDLSAAGSPTLSMTTTGALGDILINAALTTSGSATLSAARNLTFNTGIGYTQSSGTGTFLAGQAAEGLFSISSLLQTSGSAILSITSSNAPALNAITIGALTLASTGAFSSTATQGNVAISGSISSTAGGSFSVSAPGTAGAITLSGTTTSFTPGSVVSLAAAGSTALSGTSTFGNGGSGSLTISGNTAGVILSGPVTYDTTGAFLISSSGSTITTTSAGTITVSAGTGLTMNANGLITVGGTVLYNSSDVNGFAATSTAGGITITAPVTVSTTAPLALTATTAGQQVLVQNQVTNSSSGNITVTTSNLTLQPVAASTTSAELGTLSGTLALTNVTQVALIGGTAAGAFAQLGYNTGSPTSNINFTNCHSLLMQPGTATNCYTLVGHGAPTAGALTLSGNITISGTGNLTMGTSSNGTNCFSQIGHVQSLANGTIATGAISVNLGGSISMTGGNNTNAYALIGHGGVSSSTGTYTGDVTVVAGGNIILETRSAVANPSSFAAIGPTAITNGTVTITGGHAITATSTSGSIILQPAANNECVIGGYVRGTNVGNVINPLTINVTTGQDLILTGAPNPGTSLNGALVGALAYTGAVPFVAAGTSFSTLTVTVGRNLEMQTGAGGTNLQTFTAIQNGLTGGTSTTVNVAGATTLMGGNNLSTITSIGALTLNGTGDVTLLSDQTATPSGIASLIGNGNTSISGNGVTLTGFIGGPQAVVQNTTGNLSVVSNLMTLASNASIQLTGGAGTLTVNALTGDLNLNSLASIQNQGTGPTSMTVGATVSLTAGAGNVTIVNATGILTMNITDNLNLITNTGGSASITSGGPITISAQNAALFGLGTGQSLIQTTAGDILLMAMNDITLDDNALITNTGVGNVTLVADQQAPLPPQIGMGRFILNPGANVISGGGLLQVFTARPNGITAGNLAFGDLNGLPATETVVCPFDKPTPSDTNVYDTYYDLFGVGLGATMNALGAQGNPYTIYYKGPFIPPVPPIPPTPPTPVPQPVLVRNLSKISFASAQIFTFLREYPEYPKYKSDEREFYLKCKICRKRPGRLGRFCMDVDDRYPYIHQNWTLYSIGL